MAVINVGRLSEYVAQQLTNDRSYSFRVRAGGSDGTFSAWSAPITATPSKPVEGPKNLVSVRVYALAAKASGMSMKFVARIGDAGAATDYGVGNPVPPAVDADWLSWGSANFRFRYADVTALIRNPDGTLSQTAMDNLQAGLLTTGTYGGTAWNDVRSMFVRLEWTDGTFTYLYPDETRSNEWPTIAPENEANATQAHLVLDDPITEKSGEGVARFVGTGGYMNSTIPDQRFYLGFQTADLPGEEPVDTTPPIMQILTGPAPGSSTESPSSDFTYTSNEDRVTYEVKLDANDWQPQGTATSYATPNLLPGQHTVSFRATDFAGNVSDPVSRTWTVLSVEDTTPPPVPSTPTAVARNRAVDLTVPASTAPDIALYVWEKLISGNWVVLRTTSVPATTDADLTNGVLQSYRVSARDRSGNTSAPSGIATATPVAAPMTILANVEALPGNGQGRILWDPPSVEQDVDTVLVRLAEAATVAGWTDEQWKALTPIYSGPGNTGGGGRRYVDVTGLTNDTEYEVQVRPARAE